MEHNAPAFKPQWLTGAVRAAGAASLWAAPSPRADYQGNGGSSRNPSSGYDRNHSSQQPSSRRSSGSNGSQRPDRDGMRKSKGYDNFGRNREREREKDLNTRDRESRLVAADRYGYEAFSTCRPERDRLNRARSEPETWSKSVVSLNNGSADTSNADISSSRSVEAVGISGSNAVGSTLASSTSVRNVVVNASKSNAVEIAFEREFPELSSKDRIGRQGISKVSSLVISTPIQNIPLINASDGWNSVLADIPLLNDRNKSPAASSMQQSAPVNQTEAVTNSGIGLTMAETVIQAPRRSSISPQLSIETQKIEERTLRQYALRPITPSASKSSVLKTNPTRIGDPIAPIKCAQQLKLHSAVGPARTPIKADVSKLSQLASFQVLRPEQNVTAQTSKGCVSNVVDPTAPSVSVESPKNPVAIQKVKTAAHELSITLQGPSGDKKSNAREKHKFFEMLRAKSSNSSSTASEPQCQSSASNLIDVNQDSSCNLGKINCMQNEKCFCEEANLSEGSQLHLSDTEEFISFLKPKTADGVSQNGEVGSSSEPTDTGDESLSDSADGSSSFSDDGCNILQSAIAATEPQDEQHATEPPPEDKPFLISLGWREDEVVQPLNLEEIADSVKSCQELEKKLWSMESNANIKIILNILGRAK
ncbi:hypothetical protein ACP4OV_005922 [Aristida adscensionis]